MKKVIYLLLGLSLAAVTQLQADDSTIEEVTVTASLIDEISTHAENPIHVVSGDDLSNGATQSLGEAIDGLLGVQSADFGAAVGQPVIRGMSGNRVKILNNGMNVRDAAGLAADHILEVDLNNVEQIEIIRGPSSLLYTNGSIGGIVNVVDSTIARRDFDQMEFKFGAEGQSVNDGEAYDFSYQNNIGGLNISLAHKTHNFGNFDTPAGAILHSDEEHGDHEGEEEHEDEEGHGHEEDRGFVANSDFESKATRFGVSKAGDWGHFGVSVNKSDSVYGIPFHQEPAGAHGHGGHGDEHDDEHGDEHDDEHGGEHDDEHGDEHDDEHGDDHGEERIFSTTKSEVINVAGSFLFDNGIVNQVDYFFRDSDYSLTEQHAEVEGGHEGHEGHGHDEGPTVFLNEAREFGAILDLSNNFVKQKLSINIVDEDVSIIGAEAFMNPAKNEEFTIGYFASKDFGDFHVDFGVRHDQLDRKGSVTERHEHDEHEEDHDEHEEEHEEEHEGEITVFDRDFNNTSVALTIGRSFSDNFEMNIGWSLVERAPSAVELYMNGPHLATGRLETGDPSLEAEKGSNFDINFAYEKDGFFGSLSLFTHDVDNYIFLIDEIEEDHDEHGDDHGDDHGDEHEGEHGDELGGLIRANYLQQDAELKGYELELGKVFDLARGDLTVSFARDSVSGEFDDGTDIPRMVPDRNIYSVVYSEPTLDLSLKLKDVHKQTDIGFNETVSEGYEMLDFRVSKTFSVDQGAELTLSLFANNLLNEVARNHSSFVKDPVPLPGRNYGIKLSLSNF